MDTIALIIRRTKLWLSRPIKCKLGFHVFNWRERSFPLGSGMINFHCERCQKVIKKMPIDDIPKDKQFPLPNDILDVFEQ